ncbi:MAG: Gfo/Idh/MocA family oxidoreductase [Actinobacteria bacterium]|nr:Gfo/Idh/MocA family oxidoreductase [Actinomycetota bacterium]
MLKIGLSGYQSYLHATAFIEGLKDSKTVKIVSVFDENPRQAQRLGEIAGDVKVFTDLDKFVGSGMNIAILTGLPSKKLAEIKKLASEKIHILVDKPIAGTSKDAFEIVEVCKKEKVKLMVAYNLHWAQSLKQAKEILQEGKLGKPIYGFYAYDGPILQEAEWSKKLGLMCYFSNSHKLEPCNFTTHIFGYRFIIYYIGCKIFSHFW